MTDLRTRYETAQADFQSARTALELAHRAYHDGPNDAFANAKKMDESAKAQLAEHQRTREEAKATLTAAMQVSNGAITQDVKKALNARRDADDLIEQFDTLLAESARAIESAREVSSITLTQYVQAYEKAAYCWSRMNAFAALIECGDKLARAMAIVPPSNLTLPYAASAWSTAQTCKQLVLSELDALSNTYADERPYADAIGAIDTGSMQLSEIVTPTQRHIRRHQHH